MSKNLITRFLIILLLVLVVVVVYLLIERKSILPGKATPAPTAVAPEPLPDATTTERLKGCDISHWDGEIDWTSLKKSGIDFLFIKATQGTTYIDPDFEYNWQTAANYGFFRGAYHFYQPSEDPKAQAEHFLSVIKPQKGDLLPVLDIEISHGKTVSELTDDIQIWINTVKEAIGRYPIIYTDYPFWNRATSGDFSASPLWIAEWEKGSPPLLPRGWQQWAFWQYADNGTLPGIPEADGKVDLDYFHGGKQSIKNYQLK